MASKKERRKHSTRRSTTAPGKVDETLLLDGLSAGRRHVIAVLVLLVVSVSFFASFHFGGKAVAPSDTIGWRASAESIIEYRDRTGEPALWATNIFAGMPAYMISYPARSLQLDTIAKWLRGFAWPSSHFIFLLLGMYALAFLVTDDWIASVLAAIGYGLTTYLPILIVAGHNSKFVALCFAPWMVAAFVFAIKRPGILAALLFAAATAVNLRAGHVQITYFYVIGILILWIGAGISAWKAGTLPAFARSTAVLALGSILAVLMVAQPYLANAEYKELSIRGATTDPLSGSGLGWERAMAWSQGRAELVTLLVADSFGGSAMYWGPKLSTAGPHYIGGILIVLAIIALVRRRDWLTVSSGVAVAVMVLFSLGENLEWLNRIAYNVIPLFSSFRAPETWLAAAVFFVSLLGAIGLHEVLKLLRNNNALDRTVYVPWAVVTGLVLVLLLGKSSFFGFEKAGERDRFAAQLAQREQLQANDPRVVQTVDRFVAELQQDRMKAFSDDATRTLILLILAGSLVAAAASRRRFALLAAAGVVLLVLIDLFGVGRRYLSDEVMVDAGDISEKIPEYDFDSYLVSQVESAGGAGHFRVLSLESDPTTNARPSYFYESVGGYHGAKLRVFQDYLDNVLFANGINLRALDILNVRYIVAPRPVPGFSSVFTSQQTGLQVQENLSDPGRAWFADSLVVAEPGSETWGMLNAADFDPAHTAIVTTELADRVAELSSLDSTASGSIRLDRFGPREIDWSVESNHERLMVVSEIFYPKGWHATVDGQDTPIYMVDGLVRGIVVPSGSHSVSMRFDPASDRIGGIVAAGSTGVVYLGILILLFAEVRRRNDADGASEDSE